MAGNPTPVFRDDQQVEKSAARAHLPHRVGAVSDVRATDFQGVYRIYVSENRRNYDFIPSDVTSPDDGFSVIVGPNGERWKHVDIDGSGGGAFDVVVPNIAARDAYDDEKEGFLILIESDSGHGNDPWGYAKESDASGDWSTGFPIRGPAVTDGDKGDIVVSGSGATWTIETGAVTDTKLNDSAIRFAGAEESVASAGTLNLSSTKARVLLTGTTVTTAITLGNNQRRVVRVQDGWMCNVPAALRGGKVRYFPAGSFVVFESDGSGTVREVSRSLPYGSISHLEAKGNPFPAVKRKPIFLADFESNPWIDDGGYFTRASAATYYDRDGIRKTAPAGVPRFQTEYSGETGYLAEPSATNSIIRSVDFTASWTLTGILPFGSGSVADAGFASDGTQTADLIVENTGNSQHGVVSSSLAVARDQLQTFQVEFEPPASAPPRIELYINAFSGNIVNAVFDVATKTLITAVSGGNAAQARGEIKRVGFNRWRASVSGIPNTADATTGVQAAVRFVNAAGANSYTGTGTNGLILSDAQHTMLPYPTSIIPTAGSAQSRTGDRLEFPIAALPAEGTLYSEAVKLSETSVAMVIASLGAGGNQRHQTFFQDTNARFATVTSVTQANMSLGNVIVGEPVRMVGRYRKDDVAAIANIGTLATDTAAEMPAATNIIEIGQITGSSQIGVKLVKKVAVYGVGLSNTELQALVA